MENTTIKSTNTQSLKIQLSLASLMFFSPFIKHLLTTKKIAISSSDYEFVSSYISLGWINLIFLFFSLVSGFLAYFYPTFFLNTVYYSIVGILIGILFFGCIGAITETQIISSPGTKNIVFNTYTQTNRLTILLYYLPGYGIYLRYKQHNFDNSDILLKESLIIWIILGISWFFPVPIFSILIAIAILIRIITLFANINIVPTTLSNFFSSLFYKNPEEMFSYILGSLLFLFKRTYTFAYRKFCISETKKEYQYLYNLKKFGTIQRQYLLLFLACIFVFWQIDLGHISWLSMLAILLIAIRYGVMIAVWGRSPAIPFFREITLFFHTISKPFTSKTS